MSFWARWIAEWLEGLGRLTLLAKEAVVSLLRLKISWRDFLYQLYFVGVKSQSVVLITGAFTGMVLGAQTYFQFHKVKMDTATLAVVSVSMCSELGPVLTGLMVAGRVGAAIAAELGSMKVTEQLDALRAMATSPVDYLAVPRFIALIVALPMLTAEAMVIGIAAGFYVSVHLLHIDAAYFLNNMYRYTSANDVFQGLFKSLFFACFIALIACHKGFTCDEGAEGVGRATTEAVVTSSLTILIANFFIALLYNTIFPP